MDLGTFINNLDTQCDFKGITNDTTIRILTGDGEFDVKRVAYDAENGVVYVQADDV